MHTEEEKKKTKAIGRVIALMAVFFLSFILTSSRIWAFEIDTSGFSTPSSDIEDFYYWHEGLPPRDRLGSNGVGEFGYPTLITWDDKYYWATDIPFYASYGNQRGPCSSPEYNSKDYINKWGEVNGNYSLYIGIKVYWSNLYPHGNYRMLCDYPGQLLTNMKVDYNILKKYGTTISFDVPEIPILYAVDNKIVNVNNPTYFIAGSGTGGSGSAQGNANGLISDADTASAYGFSPISPAAGMDGVTVGALNDPGYAEVFNRSDSVNLFAPHMSISSHVQKATYGLGEVDYRQKTSVAFYPEIIQRAPNYLGNATAEDIKKYCWQFIGYGSRYGIHGDGYADVFISRVSDGNIWYGDHFVDYKTLESWQSRKTADIVLKTNGPYLRAHGNREGASNSFKLYYAEWNPITYLNQSFTVQNGQVTSLEGPIVIPQDTTITVQDGGVLSIKGWVINNGKIVIEPGGTMITQEDSVVSCSDKTPGLANGQIACDGLMILSTGSKVVAGGIYGMSFGEGAQCVNYGTLIAENFSVAVDHTIENRTKNSSVFAGWGISDSGYNLQQMSITGSNFDSRATIEKTRTVSIPTDGVYGAGANRLYKNADSGQDEFSEIVGAEETK